MKKNFIKIFVITILFTVVHANADAQRSRRPATPAPAPSPVATVSQTEPTSGLRADLKAVSSAALSAYNGKMIKEKEYQRLLKTCDDISYMIDKAMVDDIVTPREKEGIATRIIKVKDTLARYKHANGFY